MLNKKSPTIKVGLKTNYYENSLPYEQLYKNKIYAIVFKVIIYYNILINY
jgi:hypothetical protein